MIKRILSFLLIIVSLFLLCGSTLAESHDDVAVAYLEDAGIVNGDGASFNSERAITVREWCAMLCRANGYTIDDEWKYASKKYIDYAYEQGWVDYVAYLTPSSKMTAKYTCQSLFRFLDVVVYDGENGCVELAKKNGLIDQHVKSDTLMTRGDVANILYLALTKNITSDMPKIVDTINIVYDGEYISPSIVLKLEKIPSAILNEFNNDGWTLYIGNKYMKQFFPDVSNQCNGITNREKKIIVVDDFDSLLHEFGHFLSIQINQDSELKRIYNADCGTSTTHAQYYKSTEFEYFAECFSLYIDNKQINNNLEIYSYLNKLEEVGWIK